MTNGRGSPAAARRVAVSQARLPACTSAARTPDLHVDARARAASRRRRAATGFGSATPATTRTTPARISACVHGTGPTDVVAGLHGDHGGAAAGPVTGRGERADLGVRPAGVRVEALADDLRRTASRMTQPTTGLGLVRAETTGGQRDGTQHRRVLGHRTRHAHRSSLASPAQRGSRPSARAGEEVHGGGAGPAALPCAHDPQRPRAVSHPDCDRRLRSRQAVAPTTGSTGDWLPPGRGLDRAVGPDHRRFGISPSPASALVGMTRVCHGRRHAADSRTRVTWQGDVGHSDSGARRRGSDAATFRCGGRPRRRSPGWLLATVFISLASAIELAGVGVGAPGRQRHPDRDGDQADVAHPVAAALHADVAAARSSSS